MIRDSSKLGQLHPAVAEGIGDEGFAVEVMGCVEGFVAGGFERGDGGIVVRRRRFRGGVAVV
jgi:hypothetical protein